MSGSKNPAHNPSAKESFATFRRGAHDLGDKFHDSLRSKLEHDLNQAGVDSMQARKVSTALASNSSPSKLTPEQRKIMEGSFGRDHAGIHVLNGEQAHQLKSLAYSHGATMHFAPATANSASSSHLLAHELAHVVQQ